MWATTAERNAQSLDTNPEAYRARELGRQTVYLSAGYPKSEKERCLRSMKSIVGACEAKTGNRNSPMRVRRLLCELQLGCRADRMTKLHYLPMLACYSFRNKKEKKFCHLAMERGWGRTHGNLVFSDCALALTSLSVLRTMPCTLGLSLWHRFTHLTGCLTSAIVIPRRFNPPTQSKTNRIAGQYGGSGYVITLIFAYFWSLSSISPFLYTTYRSL